MVFVRLRSIDVIQGLKPLACDRSFRPLRQQTRRRGGSISVRNVPLLVRRKKEIGRAKTDGECRKAVGRQCLSRVGDDVSSAIAESYQDTGKEARQS